jgi:hypothetical protein
MAPIEDTLYDTAGAAEFLRSINLPISKFELSRNRDDGPEFVRWRSKAIRYPRQALLEWAASQLRPNKAA